MLQTTAGWTRRQLRARALHAVPRRYASIPRPPEKRVISDRPPERERPKIISSSTFELQHKLKLRERWTPRFLRSRPHWRLWLFFVAVGLPIGSFTLSHLPFAWYPVYGPSMRPTLNPDCESNKNTLYKSTQVIVQRWGPNATRDMLRRADTNNAIYTEKYKRGEIIVYYAPHDPETIGVKRIVGLPGDSVTPMKGYNGEENPAPVIIPFNHLWIEGDVNDRSLSVDSNYFGPISQALVQGRVRTKWSPWWNVFGMREVDSGKTGWPARNQGRVVEGAVHDATVNPDALIKKKSFEQGGGSEAMLHYLKEQPTRFCERWEDDSETGQQFRIMIRGLSTTAYDVSKGHGDAETRERARNVLLELQRLVGTKALANAATSAQIASGNYKRHRWTATKPEDQDKDNVSEGTNDIFANLVIPEDERAKEREARTNPAGAALNKMLEHKKRISDAFDKEHEELDKAKLQRSGYAE